MPSQTVSAFVERHGHCRDVQQLDETVIRGFFRRPRCEWAAENRRLATNQVRADLEISSEASSPVRRDNVDLDASSAPAQLSSLSDSSVDAVVRNSSPPSQEIQPLAASTPPPTAPIALSGPPTPPPAAPIALSGPPASRPRQRHQRIWRRFSRQTARPITEPVVVNDLKSQLALARQQCEVERRGRVAAEARSSQLHETTQRCLSLEAGIQAERAAKEEEHNARLRVEAQLSSTEVQLADVELQVEARDSRIQELEAQLALFGRETEYMVHIPYRGHRIRATPLIDSDMNATCQCYERPERDIKCMHISLGVHGSELTRFHIHANRRLGKLLRRKRKHHLKHIFLYSHDRRA